MENYGILSLVPPFLAIILAFWARQVLPALFISIWVGAAILSNGNIITGFGETVQKYVVGSIADRWHASILTVCVTLGGLIGVMTKSGGIKAVADNLARKAKTPRGSQLSTAVLGVVVFFDDYASCLIVGNTMRPITDRLKVSREKLSYLVDSTAAPVASMGIVSTWAVYEMSVIKGVFESIGIETNIYGAFLKSIPFQFYSLITLVFVFSLVLMKRDYGSMYKAEIRARKTGKVIDDNAQPLFSGGVTEMKVKENIPLRWYNAVLPLFILIGTVIAGLYITGYKKISAAGTDFTISVSFLRDVFGNSDGASAMLWGVSAATVSAIAMVILRKTLTLQEAMDSWTEGAKSVITAAMILILAWGIGSVCKDLGTASFLVEILKGRFPVELVPLLTFCVGCAIAFATGTSYGTIAILLPVSVPLVYTLSGGDTGTILYATIGAVITGAVFGDHCSPISDTTIMSSMASASDHIDHVKTQIPYAATTAVIAGVAGFIPAGFGVHPLVSFFLGALCAVLSVRVLGKKIDE